MLKLISLSHPHISLVIENDQYIGPLHFPDSNFDVQHLITFFKSKPKSVFAEYKTSQHIYKGTWSYHGTNMSNYYVQFDGIIHYKNASHHKYEGSLRNLKKWSGEEIGGFSDRPNGVKIWKDGKLQGQNNYLIIPMTLLGIIGVAALINSLNTES